MEKITASQETEGGDADKSMNKTEIKHVSDQKNHINMTMKMDGTGRVSRIYQVSGYNDTIGQGEDKEQENITDSRKMSRLQCERSEISPKFYGRSRE